jgi:hypothetical protein
MGNERQYLKGSEVERRRPGAHAGCSRCLDATTSERSHKTLLCRQCASRSSPRNGVRLRFRNFFPSPDHSRLVAKALLRTSQFTIGSPLSRTSKKSFPRQHLRLLHRLDPDKVRVCPAQIPKQRQLHGSSRRHAQVLPARQRENERASCQESITRRTVRRSGHIRRDLRGTGSRTPQTTPKSCSIRLATPRTAAPSSNSQTPNQSSETPRKQAS